MITGLSDPNGVIYVVDDDEAIRGSLAWLLEANGFRVSCHESGERFLKALESRDPTTPICALLDLNMPGLSGIEVQQKLNLKKQSIPLAFITGFGQVHTAVQAFKQGAVDFIQKPFEEKTVCDVVKKMLASAKQAQKDHGQFNELHTRFKSLTPREIQVLDLIVAGCINKEVGEKLGISIKTVEAHRASVTEKLDVSRPAALVEITLKYRDMLKQRKHSTP
jgi:FixJ family two-component response regulator